jgi:release factor glutamine methyltransferase
MQRGGDKVKVGEAVGGDVGGDLVDDIDRLGPSLYTTALIQAAQSEPLPNGLACEVGVGSGVCLLTLALKGFNELWGCDINPICIRATEQMLNHHAPHVTVNLQQGDLWTAFEAPVPFAAVLANLPHFPGEPAKDLRLPSWRGGDGRELMDRFLIGLPAFLAPNGIALITHHDLIGLAHTEALLESLGLQATCVWRWTVHENATRIASVTDKSLIDHCPTAQKIGSYWFMDSRILRISRRD